MTNRLSHPILDKELEKFRSFFYDLQQLPKKCLIQNDVALAFKAFCKKSKLNHDFATNSSIALFLKKTQEICFLDENSFLLLHRPKIAKFKPYVFTERGDVFEEITILEFLNFKDQIYLKNGNVEPESKLRVDFEPFYDYAPSLRDAKKIGNGVQFLNQFIAGSILRDPTIWENHIYKFLKIHSLNEKQLLIDGDVIRDNRELIDSVNEVISFLNSNIDKKLKEIAPELRKRGFLEGFGNNPAKMKETLQLLLDLFDAHDSTALEQFIARIPMISKIAIISPHGWFGQGNVLGKPDTGGQIVYILEQVQAMEKEMIDHFKSAGIDMIPKIIVLTRLIPEHEDTTSNQRLEKIHGTENCWILRVPFKDKKGNVIPHWISRFKVWPYLHQFTLDSKKELASEFEHRPDLIIGNYSDGNIVASYLAKTFRVIQCNIAHALEKSKYLHSDLHWKEYEKNYHFSLQFTADLISMNMANFIITSTLQEVIGTETTIGQYESYLFFSMPELFQVTAGANLFHPKFNVIPPGVDEEINFPYFLAKKRIQAQKKRLSKLLFSDEGDDIYGHLDNPDLPPIFSIARLDKIKNLTGLLRAYGKNKELQAESNLILVAGTLKEEEAQGPEEAEQIKSMYSLIEKYKLDGKIRWLCQKPKTDTGELYRLIADKKGVFVQPAIYEAFGLTIIEAMHCGLPTFATQFGGPSETIEDSVSGFLINPHSDELMSDKISSFFQKCKKDSDYWKKISEEGINRAQNRYNWKRYSKEILKLTKLYGFWKYSASAEGKRDLIRYCDMLYHLSLRQRAEGTIEGS